MRQALHAAAWLLGVSVATILAITLLRITEFGDRSRTTIVVPAEAGTQRRSSNDTGFPLSRE